jgi:hypothetical protein
MEECLQLIRARKLVEKSSKGAIAALKEDQYRVVLIMFERENENAAWRVKMVRRKRRGWGFWRRKCRAGSGHNRKNMLNRCPHSHPCALLATLGIWCPQVKSGSGIAFGELR